MGVKLLNECSHKINRAPGHSSSPRQKTTASRKKKKSRRQEKTSGITGLERRQAAGAGVDAGITAVKTLCLRSPTHTPQDESSLFALVQEQFPATCNCIIEAAEFPAHHTAVFSSQMSLPPSHKFHSRNERSVHYSSMHYGCGFNNSGKIHPF